MIKKRFRSSFMVMAVIGMFLFSGCGNSSDSSSDLSNDADGVSKNDSQTSQTVEEGDGTLNFKLDISNPGEAQENYSLAFVIPDAFEQKEENDYLSDIYFVSFPISSDGTTTVNIEDFSQIMYMGSGIGEPLSIDAVVVRTEDTNIRNPLGEPLELTFVDTTTCEQGKEFTLEITDESLLSLYPEGTFLVKIVQVPDSDDQGGYVTIRSNHSMVGTGHGSGGPDFLVAFTPSEVKNLGESTIYITDFNNNTVSDSYSIEFDSEGKCLQGQFMMIQRTK